MGPPLLESADHSTASHFSPAVRVLIEARAWHARLGSGPVRLCQEQEHCDCCGQYERVCVPCCFVYERVPRGSFGMSVVHLAVSSLCKLGPAVSTPSSTARALVRYREWNPGSVSMKNLSAR